MYSLINKGKSISNCVVMTNGNIHTLFSYNTKIAEYDTEGKILSLSKWYSATTQRHLNAFLEFHNLPIMTKKEVENYSNTF